MADIDGTEDGEEIFGTTGDDVINGLGGDDTLFAIDPAFFDEEGMGDTGAGSQATLNGGDGDDLLYMVAAGGTADGGAGRDLVYLDYNDDPTAVRYDGSGSAPTVSGPAAVRLVSIERAFVFGGAGDDVMIGGEDADTFFGGDGVDALSGRGGDDRVFGGAGADTLSGGNGADSVNGGDDDDSVSGGAGDDVLDGDDGDDIVDGGAGADDVEGGEGDDVLSGGSGVDDIDGEEGDDVVISAESPGDRLAGDVGEDTLILTRIFSSQALSIDITTAASQTLADGTVISGFERLDVVGGSGADRFTGGALGDVLVGGGGKDVLNGAGGDDVLASSAGDDRIDGGAGFDAALFIGRRSDYTITRQADGSVKVKANGWISYLDGTDILTGVETLKFADGDYLL